jgi:ribonuclease P protein component
MNNDRPGTHAPAPGVSSSVESVQSAPARVAVASRLRKHGDYQRAYKASRKQFSPSMTYFFAPQPEGTTPQSTRVGITAGRVLGNAVERNRIKRRMREAIRASQSQLPPGIDIILHPRRSVLAMAYTELRLEVERIFTKVAGSRNSSTKTTAASGKLR